MFDRQHRSWLRLALLQSLETPCRRPLDKEPTMRHARLCTRILFAVSLLFPNMVNGAEVVQKIRIGLPSLVHVHGATCTWCQHMYMVPGLTDRKDLIVSLALN